MGILAFFRSVGLIGSLSLLANLAMAGLLVAAKIDARHWHKQSAQFEQLYRAEATAHAGTIANYRAAAERARAADKANADRVKADQAAINKESTNDLEARLADARSRAARAERLRHQPQAAADPGGGRGAGKAGLPAADALIATEQAIELDELIKWVKRQAAIDPNGAQGSK